MPGKGSTFTALVHLGLPRASVAPESGDPGSASRSESFDLDGVTVLVVDDHPVNLMLATALLSDEGATAIGVKSAREALAEIRDQHFDLVLMDLEMPEMSGIEAARTLRQSAGANRNIPIIAVTAHAFPEKREEAIAAGMNDLLAKPYVPEQLFAMVQQWCRHPGVSL
jgi:CheY-like chemotaxis protein